MCAGRSDAYMPALKQYLSRYNLYLAGSTWNSSQCCTATTPCNTTDIQIKHSKCVAMHARVEGTLTDKPMHALALQHEAQYLTMHMFCAAGPVLSSSTPPTDWARIEG